MVGSGDSRGVGGFSGGVGDLVSERCLTCDCTFSDGCKFEFKPVVKKAHNIHYPRPKRGPGRRKELMALVKANRQKEKSLV